MLIIETVEFRLKKRQLHAFLAINLLITSPLLYDLVLEYALSQRSELPLSDINVVRDFYNYHSFHFRRRKIERRTYIKIKFVLKTLISKTTHQ